MRASGAYVCAFFILSAALWTRQCSAYAPLPWDDPGGTTDIDAEFTPRPRRRTTRRRRSGRKELFGTVGVSYDWTAHLAGDVQGTGGGAGYTLTIPATLPGWIIYSAIDARAVFATMTSEAWTSGFRGGGLGTSPVIDEVSFDFIYSVGSHRDVAAGGDLTLTRYGIGIRATGPGPTERRIRPGVSLGWCWHDLDFTNRQDMDATGPYLATGVEFRFESQGARNLFGLRLDARWDFMRGLDGTGGEVDAELFSSSVGLHFLW